MEDAKPEKARADDWWNGLTLEEAREVMSWLSTATEQRRIQSSRAARTWWNSLSTERRVEVWTTETAAYKAEEEA